jgi:DNA repair ATPase RecN
VLAVVKERLSVNKQVAQKFDMERFNLEKLNDMKVREQYQVKISSRFAALENLNDDYVDISRAWKSITGNMKASTTESLGYYELKQHNYGLMKSSKL